jgi:repressor LexA
VNVPNLTAKQQAVLNFVAAYLNQHNRSPLLREIQEGCSIPSYKSVVDRLNALERKGYLKREANKHRGITLARANPSTGANKTPHAASAEVIKQEEVAV